MNEESVTDEAVEFKIIKPNLVFREIDWNKVTDLKDIKNILMAMNLQIHDDVDNPDSQVNCIRHLFKGTRNDS